MLKGGLLIENRNKRLLYKWVSGTQKKAGATNSWLYQTKTFNRTMNH